MSPMIHRYHLAMARLRYSITARLLFIHDTKILHLTMPLSGVHEMTAETAKVIGAKLYRMGVLRDVVARQGESMKMANVSKQDSRLWLESPNSHSLGHYSQDQ